MSCFTTDTKLNKLKGVSIYHRPALMAVWSKAPPLTARCLSPLPWFKSRHGHVQKVASDVI